MNIFIRELKAHRKSLIFWCLGMAFMVVAGMGKFSGFSASTESMNGLVENMPKSLKIIFAFYDFDLSKVSGYFGMLFAYLLIMSTIHAAMLGANIISKEERDKTSEFLYVKPASRNVIVASKLAAAFFNAAVLNLVACISSMLVIAQYDKTADLNGTIARMMTYMFALQMVFMAIGAVSASYTKNPKTAASKSAAILLLTYILARAIEFNESLDILTFMTPFKYFDTKAIMEQSNISPVFYVLTALLIIVPIVMTFRHYNKKDLSI